MIYNKEAGCVYDTVFYCMLEFSKDNYIKYCEETYGIIDFINYYEEIKKEVPDPPQQLYPFFFRSVKEGCYLSKYHWDKYNNFEDSFTDFINKIKSDSEMKKNIYIYYLKEIYTETTLPLSDPSKLFNELFNIKIDSVLIQQLINLYYNFDMIINDLIEHLRYVYTKILCLHKVSLKLIEDAIKAYSSEKMINLILGYYKLNKEIVIAQQTISVSLLNKYLILCKRNKNNFIFILGLDAEKIIDGLIYDNNISIEWIGTITSHPIKREILERLQRDNYSATQLSEMMFVSRQTVNFHLIELRSSLCIQIAEKRGAEILYSINSNFFEAAKSIMIKYLSNFTETKNKNEGSVENVHI